MVTVYMSLSREVYPRATAHEMNSNVKLLLSTIKNE